ncbi:MAG: uridine phosphorylase [Candidatus Nanopelagicales bacterium]|nr:uridine phosphorylase [Candidatus Nanopelagicales bacterium]
MKTENINHAFLDPVLTGDHVDTYYHFGVASNDPMLRGLRDVKAVIMAGSGHRIHEFAQTWSRMNGDAEIIAFPKEERFVTRYCHGVLYASHGMGMPSASIAVQELMRMVYFLKGGDLDALEEIFWARVGTSGGVGLEGGSIVATTEGVMADLQPYRVLNGGMGEYWFDSTFPQAVIDEVVAVNAEAGLAVVPGKTVAGNEFFLEQFRLDGAICMENPDSKMAWLEWIYDNGVRNIEMEGAMLAGYLNHWGFGKFAMICTTLLNRLHGDQVTASPEQLHEYSEQSGQAMFNYLAATLG